MCFVFASLFIIYERVVSQVLVDTKPMWESGSGFLKYSPGTLSLLGMCLETGAVCGRQGKRNSRFRY